MKSFTMIPDGLRVRGSGRNKLAVKVMLAYLIRAYGYPKGQRWDDLTIGQLSKVVELTRQNTSRIFNHIVDSWEYPFKPMIEQTDDYRDLNLVSFHQWLLAIQRQAKSRVPNHPMCTKSIPHVFRIRTHGSTISEHYKNVRRLRRLKTNDERLYSIPPLVKTESDGRDRGETERIEPSEVSTVRRDDDVVPLRREGERVSRLDRPTDVDREGESLDSTDDDWIRRMEL